MVSAARRLTSWHKDAGSRVRFNSASVTTPSLFKRLSCARHFFWKVSMMDLDLLLLNIEWFSRRDGTSAGVAISSATENREQKFYIITEEIYACMITYKSNNIVETLVEKTMIGTHMRNNMAFYFFHGWGLNQIKPTYCTFTALYWTLIKCSHISLLILIKSWQQSYFFKEKSPTW